MPEQENLRIMREFFEAAQAHDAERIAAFVGEEFVLESDALPAPMIGRQVYRDLLREFYSAFPDCHYEVEQMISSGDCVAVRLLLSGTHRGEFMGKPGSGRRFEYHLCRFDQLRNAKIVHTWAYYDTGHLLRQLGFVQTLKAAFHLRRRRSEPYQMGFLSTSNLAHPAKAQAPTPSCMPKSCNRD